MKRNLITILFLIIVSFLLLFPIYVLFMSSFKPSDELFVATLWPIHATFENIKTALTTKFLNSIRTSMIVSITVTAVAMLLHSMCGYALARLQFPFKEGFFQIIVGTLMIPSMTILVPLFMVCKILGITNSYAGLIIPALFNAYGIFLFRQFYMDFPKELEEAAEVEGCSKSRIFFTIALPLSKPMIIPLTIAFFLGNWNNYLWPLVVNKKEALYTAQVYLANMVSGYSTPWHVVIASAMLASLPVFILFLFAQRQLREGIKTTGIK